MADLAKPAFAVGLDYFQTQENFRTRGMEDQTPLMLLCPTMGIELQCFWEVVGPKLKFAQFRTYLVSRKGRTYRKLAVVESIGSTVQFLCIPFQVSGVFLGCKLQTFSPGAPAHGSR